VTQPKKVIAVCGARGFHAWLAEHAEWIPLG